MNNNVVYIEFILNDDVERLGEQDALCKISAELGSKNLIYGVDFWYHDIVRNAKEKEIAIRFGFNDQHEAMILKLSGVNGATSIH